MTAKECARMWQVEAIRDGRLVGQDLTNALRHRAECSDCAREERALSELRHQFRKKGSALRPAPLQARRTRQAILSAWNEQVLGKNERRARPRLLWAIAILTACAGALAFEYPFVHPRSRVPEHPAPFFEVVAKAGALWSAREAAGVTRISLKEGFASFRIRRPVGQSLFVELPDGEIEDFGTVFDVEVRDGHTVRISVSQGRVFVRLNSLPAFELAASESWHAEAIVPPVVATEPQPRLADPPSAPAVPPTRRRPTPQVTTDSAEDDIYLHIVDLLRNGHELEARAKAAEYLTRFPKGFRRPEVTKLLEH
jgi:hypothetical protein